MNRDSVSRDYVPLILAVGLATALNMIVAGVLYDAIINGGNGGSGISENATQILTGWGGGVIGILGAVFGYRAGTSNNTTATRSSEPPPEREGGVD